MRPIACPAPAEPPLSTSLRAGDVALRAEWDDEALTGPMEAVLSYFGFEASALEASAVCLRIGLHGLAVAVPPEAEMLSGTPEGLRFYRHGALLFLRFRGTVVRIDPEAGLAEGTLASAGEAVAGMEGEALRDALLFCLVYYGVLVLLYYRGMRAVHAACLVRDGHGVLVPGVSDSGKSTLSLRLVEQGWSFLTDDSVLLRRGPQGIEASPLRRDFCVDPDAVAVFPQVAAHWRPHLADARKQRLLVRDLYPGRAASRCVPRTILFPRIVPEATSRLVPLGRTDAFLGLLEHGGALTVLDPARASEHLEDLKRLTAQARAYTLLAGRDLLEDPQAADRLLRSLTQGQPSAPDPSEASDAREASHGEASEASSR